MCTRVCVSVCLTCLCACVPVCLGLYACVSRYVGMWVCGYVGLWACMCTHVHVSMCVCLCVGVYISVKLVCFKVNIINFLPTSYFFRHVFNRFNLYQYNPSMHRRSGYRKDRKGSNFKSFCIFSTFCIFIYLFIYLFSSSS